MMAAHQLLIAALAIFSPRSFGTTVVEPTCPAEFGGSRSPARTPSEHAAWLLAGFDQAKQLPPALAFPGAHEFSFNPRVESVERGLAYHAESLAPDDQGSFRRGLADALASLDLGDPSAQVIASHLAVLALELKAPEVIEILPDLRLPPATNARLSNFLFATESLARLGAEVRHSSRAVLFLRNIWRRPGLTNASRAGFALVALAHAEPALFPNDFLMLKTYLAQRFSEGGGAWIIEHLRDAGVAEADLRAPSPVPPAWWRRMLSEAKGRDV